MCCTLTSDSLHGIMGNFMVFIHRVPSIQRIEGNTKHYLMCAGVEKGDLAEFKQCLAVLRPLRSRGVRTALTSHCLLKK